MLHFALIITLIIHSAHAHQTSSDSIFDLYEKITSYGSLFKATSFISSAQIKLKNTNTVRVTTYNVAKDQSSIVLHIRKTPKEELTLIELRSNLSNISIRLNKFSRFRRLRLRRISQTVIDQTSYDITAVLHKSKSRRIILNFDRPIDNEKISIVYYSKSNRNLFSLPSLTRVKRRFRRTIIPTDVQSQTCAKHEYEIDFNQFSFGQWILQPKTFNAYICAGTCPNPLSPRYFPSNHAILLSLIRSQQSQGQEPSCVPVKFKPLCLLYYEKDELVIKYHRDMIVEECGCR